MYSAIAANKRNSVFIILVFIAVIGLLGWLIATWFGTSTWTLTVAVLIFAGLYAWFQYYNAGKIAVMSAGAVEIQQQDNPRLYRIVENLAITNGMPTPKVYIVEDPAPNAFASGRDPEHAVVCATTGLLEIMTDPELEGVMAHEMGHIKNYDIRVSTVIFGLVFAIGIVTDIAFRIFVYSSYNRSSNSRDNSAAAIMMFSGLFALFASIISFVIGPLIQAGVSRQREYLADATGAMTTRNPEGLASALHKLAEYGRPLQKQSTSMAHLWMSDPLKPGLFARLYATHPPIPDRIRRLLDIGGKF
jgi:heat shock protein HtpX